MRNMSTNTTKYFDDPDISRILTRILEDQGGFCPIENRTGAGQEAGEKPDKPTRKRLQSEKSKVEEGQAELDELLSGREKINAKLQEIIDKQTDPLP